MQQVRTQFVFSEQETVLIARDQAATTDSGSYTGTRGHTQAEGSDTGEQMATTDQDSRTGTRRQEQKARSATGDQAGR